jgi:hypothetical protein
MCDKVIIFEKSRACYDLDTNFLDIVYREVL